ncbi:unnamed protein product [Caenorhabditis angaria]|uniref:Uncharacterized protein n=1 Tax=Caenorhabditis angaria TaxID=860376 RepID=A0A9P1IVW7_9PELO|nr:unnamed protein product [Caenorhabditis angaria]
MFPSYYSNPYWFWNSTPNTYHQHPYSSHPHPLPLPTSNFDNESDIIKIFKIHNQPLAMKIHRDIDKELYQVETDMMDLKHRENARIRQFENEKSTKALCDRYIIMDLLGPSIFQVLDSEHPACFESEEIF